MPNHYAGDLLHTTAISGRSRVRTELLPLLVVPALTPHPVQVNREFPGHRHLGDLPPSPHREVEELAAPLWVAAHRDLGRFHQQEPQQRVTLFADMSQPPPIAAGLLRRNQSHIAGDLLTAVKPSWSSNDQLEGQRRQHADSGMGHQSPRCWPLLCFLFQCSRHQADEIWQFCGAKAKNVTLEQKAQGWGDTWTWTGLDADTKLCLSYLVGGRSANWAMEFMLDCAARIKGRVQVTTDGHKAYLEAVETAFGATCDYAMLQKIYGAPMENDTRYSPATCIGCDMKVVSGDPDPKHVSTSYVERHNLTMRMSMRRFTRLTNGFSKKIENHIAMVAIYAVHYNFARIHKTLRITPSMAAGLSDHVWSLEEIVMMADSYAPTPAKRGPYKRQKSA
jgi:IS1 family transposase